MEHKRRVRYKGTHPKNFSEKYKELKPELYADEIKKIKDSGKTPAGSHRPILVKEVLERLNLKNGDMGVDATLGFGGHAEEILKKISPQGKLYGFDIDSQEIAKTTARLIEQGYDEKNFIPCQNNFSEILHVLKEKNAKKLDFILADLGVSSMQLDNPLRGFSYKLDGPLDLRMDQSKGIPAYLLLKTFSKEHFLDILLKNSDETYAFEITRHIFKSNHVLPCKTTQDFKNMIIGALQTVRPRLTELEVKRSVRRSFQALRIEVNQEFKTLEIFLSAFPSLLKSGARIAILTFHSGEDRRVKHAFKEGLRKGIYKEVARRVTLPSEAENYSNPRAKSAKLRFAIRA
jgi:16S rRNA (cytosine1402-N4)-methyltransferase